MVGPVFIIGVTVSSIFTFMLSVSSLRLAFNNLDCILTSPIDFTKALKPRIPGISNVVVVNNQNRDKIVLCDRVQENQECWLSDQRLLNLNCNIKPTKIFDVIDLVLPDLSYKNTVNVQDVTGLDRVEFTNKFDLGQTEPSIYKPRQGKEVNFLEKFGDSRQIDESEK